LELRKKEDLKGSPTLSVAVEKERKINDCDIKDGKKIIKRGSGCNFPSLLC
jgi:hypothetical protein